LTHLKSSAALPLPRPARSTNSAEVDYKLRRGKQGDVTVRRSIVDYHSFLARAVSRLDKDNAETREDLYGRARATLEVEFEKRDPPPSAVEVFEERLKLNVAIHDFEWSSVAEVA
jgi:hypothetical protein